VGQSPGEAPSRSDDVDTAETVLIIQQQDGATPGWLAEMLAEAGVAYRVVRPYAGPELPDHCRWKAVVPLGGEMGAYERDRYPFLATERDFLRAAVTAGTPVFAICLGAQLLADGLGGRAYPMEAARVGYYDLALTPAGERDPVLWQLAAPVLVWHGDTFDLPDDAELLAEANGRPYAYRLGYVTWAVQFHPEASPELVDSWLATFTADEIAQMNLDVAALRAQVQQHAASARRTSWALFEAWLAQIGS
jgi:GMP synthase (glutamine-hydrolysing)